MIVSMWAQLKLYRVLATARYVFVAWCGNQKFSAGYGTPQVVADTMLRSQGTRHCTAAGAHSYRSRGGLGFGASLRMFHAFPRVTTPTTPSSLPLAVSVRAPLHLIHPPIQTGKIPDCPLTARDSMQQPSAKELAGSFCLT